MRQQKNTTFNLVLFSILLALEAVVCFTFLGSLPIGPLVATLSHIPVILTAVLLGTGYGTLAGGFFGLFSFLVWTYMPPSPLYAFLFTPVHDGNIWSLVICFVPRILIGLVAGLTFSGLSRIKKIPDAVSLAVAGVLGSMTNTALVITGFYLFFAERYATLEGISIGEILIRIVGINGLLEAALAGFVAAVVGKVVLSFRRRRNG